MTNMDTQDNEAMNLSQHQTKYGILGSVHNKQLPSKQHPKCFSKGGIIVKADSQPDLDKK